MYRYLEDRQNQKRFYYLKNKEYINCYKIDWYKNNRARVLLKAKQNYDKELRHIYNKNYYEINKQKLSERHRWYRTKNKSRKKEYNRLHYLRKKIFNMFKKSRYI